DRPSLRDVLRQRRRRRQEDAAVGVPQDVVDPLLQRQRLGQRLLRRQGDDHQVVLPLAGQPHQLRADVALHRQHLEQPPQLRRPPARAPCPRPSPPAPRPPAAASPRRPRGARSTPPRGSSPVSPAWNRWVRAGPSSCTSSPRSAPTPAARSSATVRARRSLIFGMRLPPPRSRYMSRSLLKTRTVRGGGVPPCRLIQ